MDPKKELAGRVAADVGGAFTTGLAYIGDRLGLFRSLAEGAATSRELASRLSLDERYVREWLRAMVASEYVEFDGNRYFMTEDQKEVLADEESPAFLAGSFHLAAPSLLNVPRIMDAFRRGGGVPFAELGREVAEGIDRLHKPAFEHFLVQEWLPGVPGLVPRLEEGIRVLDLGCGLGRSSKVIAKAFPATQVTALDPDRNSIERAREVCRGLENVRFAATIVGDLPEAARFDLVLAFDCIHDMVDPVRELREIRARLTPGTGELLWVEPTGSTDPRENRNPIARLRASISPLHCLTVSLAEGGAGLGTIIGEGGARSLADAAGFPSFEKLEIDNPYQQFFLLKS